jgi:ketosteroid isomerase-like protein
MRTMMKPRAAAKPAKKRAKKITAAADYAALVKVIYAAFGRGDIPRVLEGLSEDVEWFVPGPPDIPYAGARRGKGQVAEFFNLLGQSVEFERFEPREYIAQENKVAVVGRYAGKVKSNGNRFEEDWVMAWTFKGVKVAVFREYMDPARLAEAFGG